MDVVILVIFLFLIMQRKFFFKCFQKSLLEVKLFSDPILKYEQIYSIKAWQDGDKNYNVLIIIKHTTFQYLQELLMQGLESS